MTPILQHPSRAIPRGLWNSIRPQAKGPQPFLSERGADRRRLHPRLALQLLALGECLGVAGLQLEDAGAVVAGAVEEIQARELEGAVVERRDVVRQERHR